MAEAVWFKVQLESTRRGGDEGKRRWLVYAPERPKRKRCKPRDLKGGARGGTRGERLPKGARGGDRGGALTTAHRGRRKRMGCEGA